MGSTRERPILMADAMVRRLLAGEKTQTRRVITPSLGGHTHSPFVGEDGLWRWATGAVIWRDDERRCPFGKSGDRLWVRETWALDEGNTDGTWVVWKANRAAACVEGSGLGERFCLPSDYEPGRWRPSIHMPRWACRTLLEVTDVRVQRLQDLSEDDAKAEGARHFEHVPTSAFDSRSRWSMEEPSDTGQCLDTPRLAFGNYVNKLHGGPSWNLRGEPSLWEQNPWVWAVTFRRVEGAP